MDVSRPRFERPIFRTPRQSVSPLWMHTGDEIEELAERVKLENGFEDGAQVTPDELVERVLGPGAIRFVPRRALPGFGAAARVAGRWSVFIVEDAPAVVRRFVLLHELSHVLLGRTATERECDALAAALLVPKRALLRAVGERGARLSSLARVFGATESCIGLRLGEVTHQPTALVAPASVRIRGSSYPWPPEADLRRAAEGRATPGLRKARLRDDATRSLLRVI
jgi:hypothetical protein